MNKLCISIISLLIVTISLYGNNENIVQSKNDYIISNIVLNKKYIAENNNRFLSNILLGEWESPPHAVIIFCKNKEFIYDHDDNYRSLKVNGNWEIKNNKIELRKDSKIWKTYDIDCFLLKKSVPPGNTNNKVIRYRLEIVLRNYDNFIEALIYDFRIK